VAVQEVIWDKDPSQSADDYTFFSGNENGNNYLGIGCFYIRELDQQLK